MSQITIRTKLSFASSFRFPVQTSLSRRELAWGSALLVLLPGVGWLLNMGHRIAMVHNMQHGRPAWPAWRNYPRLLRDGGVTFLGMLYYYAPGVLLGVVGWRAGMAWLSALGALLLVLATLAIPGFMSHYCYAFDASEIFNPAKALRRSVEGGSLYWRAWAISLTALGLSFAGLAALGVGFLFSSVWFWQAAGFSFASVFSQKFGLGAEQSSSD